MSDLKELVTDSVETAKVQVKTSLKTHIQHKLQQHAESTASLLSRVRELEIQNQTLKSQVGDLKKQLVNRNVCNATPSPLTASNANQPDKDKPSCQTSLQLDSPSHPSPCSNGLLAHASNCRSDSNHATPTSTLRPPSSPAEKKPKQSSHPSPREQLNYKRVTPGSTHVLISDCVVCF